MIRTTFALIFTVVMLVPGADLLAAASLDRALTRPLFRSASAPFELVGKHQAVNVMINGKGPYKFLFDTGAGDTSIDKSLAEELKLVVTGKSSIGDPQNPEAYSADEVKIPRIEMGDIVFKNAKALSYDLSQIFGAKSFRGVIGMPLFADSLLTVDYPNNRISISRGSLPAPNGKDIFAFEMADGNFSTKMTIAGKTSDIVIDSGSTGGFTVPKKLADELPWETTPVEIGRARTVNNRFAIYGAKLNGTINIGGVTFDHPKVAFNEVLPVGTLGYDVLKDFTITIDQKNLRMRFTRPATN